MTTNEICYRLQAMATMCTFQDAVGHDLSHKEIGLYNQAKDLAIQLVKDNTWIPVTERMPKEREWIGTKRFGTTISDEVYVTFETLDGKRFCDHIRFQNGKLSPSSQISIDAISKGAKPIAWMPLPKPYEVNTNDTNE